MMVLLFLNVNHDGSGISNHCIFCRNTFVMDTFHWKFQMSNSTSMYELTAWTLLQGFQGFRHYVLTHQCINVEDLTSNQI